MPPLQGLLLFIIGGLVILAYCSQASNERTYQEVVWAVCGRVLGVLCEVAIVVYTFGTCIAFLIIIGDQQDKSECGSGRHGVLSLDFSQVPSWATSFFWAAHFELQM